MSQDFSIDVWPDIGSKMMGIESICHKTRLEEDDIIGES
jgi:hypothetical protein